MVATPPDNGQPAGLHHGLVALGHSSLAPLTARMHDVQQRFAAEVAAVGRRMVDEALGVHQAQLVQLVNDLRRREVQDRAHAAPLIVHLIVRFE